jgi:Cytochrome c554 and c-prime
MMSSSAAKGYDRGRRTRIRVAFEAAWLPRAALVALIMAGTAGCFLMSGPPRPDPEARSGVVPYAENCVACHAKPTAVQYAESRHAAEGIRCGQCHTPGGHPDFSQPVRDGKCGGCHQAQYQQTVASKHFAGRAQRSLDSDRELRTSLRRQGFTEPTDAERAGMPHVSMARRFVGDSDSGPLGGRLCAACHYDDHRLGLGAVQRENFCVGCHRDREQHFADVGSDSQNRCATCHVRVGATVAGQVVNTHRFAKPGTEDAAR